MTYHTFGHTLWSLAVSSLHIEPGNFILELLLLFAKLFLRHLLNDLILLAMHLLILIIDPIALGLTLLLLLIICLLHDFMLDDTLKHLLATLDGGD